MMMQASVYWSATNNIAQHVNKMPVKLLKKLTVLFLLLEIGTAFSQVKSKSAQSIAVQPIPVSFPTDATGEPDSIVTIPIITGDITNRDVSQFSTLFTFDPNVLQYQTFSIAGTISEPLGIPDQNILNDSTVSIGKSGNQRLSGSGAFINIIFKVVGKAGDTSVLKLTSFTFNTGVPVASLSDGLFTVVSPPSPIISVQPVSFDFGNTFIDTTVTTTFSITNTGTADLIIDNISLIGTNADAFTVENLTVPLNIAPNQTLPFDVSFSPGTPGAKTATLRISSNDPATGIITIPVQGLGVERPKPILTIQPDSLDFGAVAINTITEKSLFLKNDGSEELAITSLNIMGNNASEFIISSDMTTFTLQPGDSQAVSLQFSPMTTGLKAAFLQVNSNDLTRAIVDIPLTGQGVEPPKPQLTVSPDSLDFGSLTIDTSVEKSLLLMNNGTADLAITSLTIGGDNAADFELLSQPIAFTLPPADSQAVSIRFTPKTTGFKTAFLQVTSNDPGSPEISIPITGTGISNAPVFFSIGDSVHFSGTDVNSSITQSVYLFNKTAGQIRITSSQLLGADSSEFALMQNGVPFSIASGDSAQFSIKFSPTTFGEKASTLEIIYENATTDTLRLILHGLGLSSQLQSNKNALDFGFLEVDSARTKQFSIKNTGNAALIINQSLISGANPNNFILTNDLTGLVIAPGDSQIVSITFSPSDSGTSTAQLNIRSNDPATEVFVLSLTGIAVKAFQFTARIVSPRNGAKICTQDVPVIIEVETSGGLSPFKTICKVNGYIAIPTGNTFRVTIPLQPGENQLIAKCTLMDGLGMQFTHTDTIIVIKPEKPFLTLKIATPEDGSDVTGDSVLVKAMITLSKGAPPFSIDADINGIPATIAGPLLQAMIPLNQDTTFIIAEMTVTDSCGLQTFSADTIQVFKTLIPQCQVTIVSPENGRFVSSDSITVTAKLTTINVKPTEDISCSINGFVTSISTDSVFQKTIPLQSGDNVIIANCLMEDNGTVVVDCSDTVSVFLDDIAPDCTFEVSDSMITGTFFDHESGIAHITPVEIRNGTLTFDSFEPGAKTVDFIIRFNDANKGVFFSIDVTDACGNTTNCDPVVFTLSTQNGSNSTQLSFPGADKFLQISNHGLTAITLTLNEKTFKLFTDQKRATQETNAHYLPANGDINIDLSQFIKPNNILDISYQGDSDAYADIFITESTERVDYVLEITQPPQTFQLSQNFPNPFNPATQINFDIPENENGMVRVQIRIYNLLGELVKTLVDENKAPGRYSINWDGKDQNNRQISSGVYLYQLVAGTFRQTHRMTLLK